MFPLTTPFQHLIGSPSQGKRQEKEIRGAMDRILVTPRSSYVETLIPSGIVSGAEASGREFGHEGGALMITSALRHETACFTPLSVSASPRYNKKVAICKPGQGPPPRTQPCWHVNQASRTLRNKCLLLKPPSPWCLVTAAQTKSKGKQNGKEEIQLSLCTGDMIM